MVLIALQHSLGGNFASNFLIFAFPHLKIVELAVGLPAEGEGCFFAGWIEERAQGGARIRLPVAGGTSQVRPEENMAVS